MGFLLLSTATTGAATPAPSSREYQVKAAFLFNFTQFVAWPPHAFATPQSPFIVGVLGDDPFGPLLEEMMHGESTGGRPLVTRRFRRVQEIDECHLLFISASEAPRIDRILEALKHRVILTVGDADGFARRGVMVRLSTENRRIHLKINLGAARRVGLVFSSKLLRPAEIIADVEPTL